MKRSEIVLPDFIRVWRSASVGWAWECEACPYGTRYAHLTKRHAEQSAKDHANVFHTEKESERRLGWEN
jgi:uncharacterized protein (DUF736 family)